MSDNDYPNSENGELPRFQKGTCRQEVRSSVKTRSSYTSHGVRSEPSPFTQSSNSGGGKPRHDEGSPITPDSGYPLQKSKVHKTRMWTENSGGRQKEKVVQSPVTLSSESQGAYPSSDSCRSHTPVRGNKHTKARVPVKRNISHRQKVERIVKSRSSYQKHSNSRSEHPTGRLARNQTRSPVIGTNESNDEVTTPVDRTNVAPDSGYKHHKVHLPAKRKEIDRHPEISRVRTRSNYQKAQSPNVRTRSSYINSEDSPQQIPEKGKGRLLWYLTGESADGRQVDLFSIFTILIHKEVENAIRFNSRFSSIFLIAGSGRRQRGEANGLNS